MTVQDYRDARRYTVMALLLGLAAALLGSVLLNRSDLVALAVWLTLLGAVVLFVLSVIIVSAEASVEATREELDLHLKQTR